MAGVRVLVALALVLPAAQALYFHIKESETKCFIEEIPDETMVQGTLGLLPPPPPLVLFFFSSFPPCCRALQDADTG